MLTDDEKDYLSKIPPQKKVRIRPFRQKTSDVSNKLVRSIKVKYPDLKILHMGASGLGISGQGDIDIYAFANPTHFPKYLSGIIKVLGEPKSYNPDSVAWKLNQDGHDIEFYLTNPESESMKRTSFLANNGEGFNPRHIVQHFPRSFFISGRRFSLWCLMCQQS